MQKRMFKYFIISIEFYRRAGATSSQKWIGNGAFDGVRLKPGFQLGHFFAEMDRILKGKLIAEIINLFQLGHFFAEMDRWWSNGIPH